ncbi:MAG: hypothetical protein JW888_14185 [Pirellulales bacterium]|nr:hypothetical protein [Pirellulales bacterium]
MRLRRTVQVISWLALAATIAPSVAYLAGLMTMVSMKWAMLAATAVWFTAAPLWMGRAKAAPPE